MWMQDDTMMKLIAEEYIQRRLRAAQTRQSLIQAGLVRERWIHRFNSRRNASLDKRGNAIERWITRQGKRLGIAPTGGDDHRTRVAPTAWRSEDAIVDEKCCPVAA